MFRPHAATLNNAMLKVNRTRFDYIRRDRPNTRGRSQETPTHYRAEDKTDGCRKSQTRRSRRPFLHHAVFKTHTMLKSVYLTFFSSLNLDQGKKTSLKLDLIHFRLLLAGTTEIVLLCKSESVRRRQRQRKRVCTMTMSLKTNSGPAHVSC